MYTDNTILTWGKYKFTSLKNVPASWLLANHKNNSLHDKELLEYISNNLDRLKELHEKGFTPPEVKMPCTKYQYASEEEAKKHLREIRKKGKQSPSHVLPVRAYNCPICKFYHLTSRP